jgi:general secretion pathway protein E
VRRLCPACRRAAPAPAELIQRFDLAERGNSTGLTLQHPVGCPECRHTGYRGRFAIAEFLTLNPEIEHLIFGRADHNSIERAAIAAGMRTLLQCGLDAVLAGETTVEEVVRSVRTDS